MKNTNPTNPEIISAPTTPAPDDSAWAEKAAQEIVRLIIVRLSKFTATTGEKEYAAIILAHCPKAPAAPATTDRRDPPDGLYGEAQPELAVPTDESVAQGTEGRWVKGDPSVQDINESEHSLYHQQEKIKTMNQQKFKEAVEPLVRYLQTDECHPHMTVVVTSTHAEIMEGLISLPFSWPIAALKSAPVPEAQKPGESTAKEDDGCPTEKAVLQRFWRSQKSAPVSAAQGTEGLEKAQILDWLHSGGGPSYDGWEYGVMRVKYDQHGQLLAHEWTLSDHSDVLAAMREELTGQPFAAFARSLERALQSSEAALAEANRQIVMDTVRFTEMRAAGDRLEVELAESKASHEITQEFLDMAYLNCKKLSAQIEAEVARLNRAVAQSYDALNEFGAPETVLGMHLADAIRAQLSALRTAPTGGEQSEDELRMKIAGILLSTRIVGDTTDKILALFPRTSPSDAARDTERLDWLASRKHTEIEIGKNSVCITKGERVGIVLSNPATGTPSSRFQFDNPYNFQGDLRQAIDAARQTGVAGKERVTE